MCSVGIIHTNGKQVSEEANGRELLRFTITFLMSWKLWVDVTQFITWFETDDIFIRMLCLIEICLLLGCVVHRNPS